MRTRDHSRSAVAALQAMLLLKSFLMSLDIAVLGYSFDRSKIRSVSLNRKPRARLNRQPISQNRAGATYAGFTTDVRPRQAGVVSNEVRQQQPGFNICFIQLSINCYFHAHTLSLLSDLHAVGRNGRIVCKARMDR